MSLKSRTISKVPSHDERGERELSALDVRSIVSSISHLSIDSQYSGCDFPNTEMDRIHPGESAPLLSKYDNPTAQHGKATSVYFSKLISVTITAF